MTFLAQNFFWCYLIAISFGNNILFTELKNLARSSNGGRRRNGRQSQISAFSIQIILEKQDPEHTFLPFLMMKITSNHIVN